MTTQTTDQLAHQAALGSRPAMAELKAAFPNREFRRKFCDLRGTVVLWRAKGSAGKRHRLAG